MSHVIAVQQPISGTLAAQPAANAAAVIEHRWVALYRVAGVSALLTGVLIPLQIAAFIAWPPPQGEVVRWFNVFQDSALIGLISSTWPSWSRKCWWSRSSLPCMCCCGAPASR